MLRRRTLERRLADLFDGTLALRAQSGPILSRRLPSKRANRNEL
jgi:hypothetical protein